MYFSRSTAQVRTEEVAVQANAAKEKPKKKK